MKGGWKMKQICIGCKTQYGIKEPVLDKSETHGICNECLSDVLKRKDNIKKMFRPNINRMMLE